MIREVPWVIHPCFLQLSRTTKETQREIQIHLTVHLLTSALSAFIPFPYEFKHFPSVQYFYLNFMCLGNNQS